MALNRVWIPSPNFSSRGGTKVRLIVLHTAEGATTYQSLGSFFANPSSGVSSQTGIDDTPNTVGEYVKRENKPWTQGNANPYSVSTELCAFAKWDPAEWQRHPTMLANTAAWIAEEAAAFGIPIVRLNAQQAQGGGTGVCQHVDLGAAGGGHWDCGPSFPMDQVIAMAKGQAPPIPVDPDVPVPPKTDEEVVVVSRVVKHRGNVLSCAQASKGQLWHKFSQDGGVNWTSKPLIRPSGDPVKATVKDTVDISVEDGTLFISTEDTEGGAWMCRQTADVKTGWDIRKMP